MKFQVWDVENGTREDALLFEENSEEEAAEKYASQDTDGISSNLYGSGHPIAVLVEDAKEPVIYTVTVDWDPCFFAVRKSGQ